MADVHVTLRNPAGVVMTATYIDTQQIVLQGGSSVAASTLTAGQVLSDGREVLGIHAADPAAGIRNLAQAAFRARNDDGSETTATWKAAENTNWTQAVDEVFRIRFVVDETGSLSVDRVSMQLEYNQNSTGWAAVYEESGVVNPTEASDVISPAASAVSNDTETTRQLVGGSGTFVAGEIDTINGLAGIYDGRTLPTGYLSEVEYSIRIIGAHVANNDVIQLRVRYGGMSDLNMMPLDAYTNTPTVTVSEIV